MITKKFAIVPNEVFRDPRLTLRQIKVLGALFSFRGKNTDTTWPTREKLSMRCGLRVTRISTVTTELEALGWLVKVGNGGRSMATRYQLIVPKDAIPALDDDNEETVPETGTVTDAETVPEPGTVSLETVPESGETVPESGTQTVPEPGTRKEQTKEQTKEHKKKERASALDLSILPEDLSKDVWADFLKHRKEIKAPVTTQTGIKSIADALKRCGAAGISADEALTTAISSGWRGFKPEWILKNKETFSKGGPRHAVDQFSSQHYTGTPVNEIDWL